MSEINWLCPVISATFVFVFVKDGGSRPDFLPFVFISFLSFVSLLSTDYVQLVMGTCSGNVTILLMLTP